MAEAGSFVTHENIVVEALNRVGVIRLNRPKAYNALNTALKREVDQALASLESDSGIGCIILTGSDKAFAAGADVNEILERPTPSWTRISEVRKPIIAAVGGVALGGGCEIAMQCDFIIASDTAKFGQPEIKIGVIPGTGGTQRLVRAVGKAKAMELIMTGRMMDAMEAERSGLVARVVPAPDLLNEAIKSAEAIADMSLPSLIAAKTAVNAAFEMPLSAGLEFEQERYSALFPTEDQREGMLAFIEKRKPRWAGR